MLDGLFSNSELTAKIRLQQSQIIQLNRQKKLSVFAQAALKEHGKCAHLRALELGQIDLAKELIKSGWVNVDESNADGDTALHLAVRLKNHGLIKALNGVYANPCIINQAGFTPIEPTIKESNDISLLTTWIECKHLLMFYSQTNAQRGILHSAIAR